MQSFCLPSGIFQNALKKKTNEALLPVGGESRMERQPEWSTRPQRNEPFKRLFSTPYGMWNHQSMMILPYDVVVAEVVTACMTHGLIAEWVSQGIAAGPGIP